MTVIVFLIDNSASMSQRTYLGTSLLDIAKGCVEDFYKIRLKFSRSDRYYIYTLDKEPNGIKPCECKQNLHMIRAAMDVIKPNGYSSLGVGIRRTFDMLNLLRMNNGYENYGMGRYPTHIEHAIVVCITDGGKLTSECGITNGDLNLPLLLPTVPGYEYTSEPFRWDYRLYSIVLRFPAFLHKELQVHKFIPTDEQCPISSMCEVTGGRAYKITNERMLHQCLESLSQKCYPGVVLHFMKLDETSFFFHSKQIDYLDQYLNTKIDSKTSEVNCVLAGAINKVNGLNECIQFLIDVWQFVLWLELLDDNEIAKSEKWHACKKMIYVKSSTVGVTNAHWPIPESFWPDEHMSDKLPPRTAHPIMCYSTTKMPVPKIMDHFPLDKYELEPSPLTQYILERRDSNFVWHCYIPKSGKFEDYPFGYLRSSADHQSVYLFVLSYNFPALIDLLSNLSDTFKMRINDAWGSKFAHYLGLIPKYYFSPLSRAFERIGLPYLIKQESIERILPYSVKNNLQKLRQMAKVQYDVEQRVAPVVTRALLYRHNDLLKRGHSRVSGGGAGDDQATDIEVVSCKVARLDVRSYLIGGGIVDRSLLRSLVSRSVTNLSQYCTHNIRPMTRETINEQPMCQMGDYSNYQYSTGVSLSCALMDPYKDIHPGQSSLAVRRDIFAGPLRRKAGNTSTFEADEKFVEEMMCVAGTVSSTGNGARRHQSSCEMGRTKGPLPYSVTYYNWRRSESSGSADIDGAWSPPVLCTPMPSVDHSLASDTGIAASSVDPTRQHYHHDKTITRRLMTLLRHPRIGSISSCVHIITTISTIDGSLVLELLTKYTGPCKLQCAMIARAVTLARQFKKWRIAALLEQYMAHLHRPVIIEATQATVPIAGRDFS